MSAFKNWKKSLSSLLYDWLLYKAINFLSNEDVPPTNYNAAIINWKYYLLLFYYTYLGCFLKFRKVLLLYFLENQPAFYQFLRKIFVFSLSFWFSFISIQFLVCFHLLLYNLITERKEKFRFFYNTDLLKKKKELYFPW